MLKKLKKKFKEIGNNSSPSGSSFSYSDDEDQNQQRRSGKGEGQHYSLLQNETELENKKLRQRDKVQPHLSDAVYVDINTRNVQANPSFGELSPAGANQDTYWTEMNSNLLRNEKGFSIETKGAKLEFYDFCFVFPAKYDPDPMVSKEEVIETILEVLWKRCLPTNAEEAIKVVQDKGSVQYLSEVYNIKDTIDSLPEEGIPKSQLCQMIQNNFLYTLMHTVPCEMTFLEGKSDGMELKFVKVRITENTARKIADESEYLVQMDRRVANHDEFKADPEFVPPYMAYEEQFEELPELACMRTVGMIWARYDKLSRPVILDNFETNSPELSIFKDVDRVRLLHRGLELLYNFSAMTDSGAMHTMYPLHQSTIKKQLMDDWSRIKYAGSVKQPLDEVRDYYGEEVALYFAWLGFYTKALKYPAFFGCGVFMMQAMMDRRLIFDNKWVNIATLAFSAFLISWNTYFFYQWKRLENLFSLRWGLETNAGMATRERERNDFYADRYIKDPVQPARWIRSYSKKKLKLRSFISNSTTALLTIITVVCCNSLFHTKVMEWLNINDKTEGLLKPFLGKFAEDQTASAWVISFLVKAFDLMFTNSVETLVNFENHQFENDYKESLVTKLFFFKALDYFTPLVYIAFVKHYFDPCKGPSCLGELRSQLVSLFMVDFASNVVEVGSPWVTYWFNRYRNSVFRADPAQNQMQKLEYEDTVEDFQEMITQLGLVSLFSIVCPIIPMLAWISNHFEIRIDALKLVKCHRRPFPREVHSIGAWITIIQIMAVLSVIVNTAMVVFATVGRSYFFRLQLTCCIIFLGTMFAVKEAVQHAWPEDTQKSVIMRSRMVMVGHEAFWGMYNRKHNEAALTMKLGNKEGDDIFQNLTDEVYGG